MNATTPMKDAGIWLLLLLALLAYVPVKLGLELLEALIAFINRRL